jgi:hypothetical protein
MSHERSSSACCTSVPMFFTYIRVVLSSPGASSLIPNPLENPPYGSRSLSQHMTRILAASGISCVECGYHEFDNVSSIIKERGSFKRPRYLRCGLARAQLSAEPFITGVSSQPSENYTVSIALESWPLCIGPRALSLSVTYFCAINSPYSAHTFLALAFAVPPGR